MTAFRIASIILTCITIMPVMAQQKANAQIASLQKQVKSLTEERDALKLKVDEIPSLLRQEQAELYRQLDEVAAQREQALLEAEQLRATLRENQSGGDSLLRELQLVKGDLKNSNDRVEYLENELAVLRSRLDETTVVKDGALVHQGPDITPAKCLNLRRMTPTVRKVSGIVVVNCLINELGDTTDVRLIQELPGEQTEWTEKAHEACLEAAKHLVFEPATNNNGVRLKVWQGVAFHLK